MAAKAKRRPSPAEWAAEHPAKGRGIPCWLCVNPSAAELVREFRALVPPQPAQSIAAYLRKFCGYPYPGYSTVERHVREHGGRR